MIQFVLKIVYISLAVLVCTNECFIILFHNSTGLPTIMF